MEDVEVWLTVHRGLYMLSRLSTASLSFGVLLSEHEWARREGLV